MANPDFLPEDLQDELETARYQTIDQVKLRFRRARVGRRLVVVGAVGLAIGAGLAHANDSKAALPLAAAIAPLGAINAGVQRSVKKNTAQLVGAFVTMEDYGKSEPPSPEDVTGKMSVVPANGPDPNWFERNVAGPTGANIMSTAVSAFGLYALAAEALSHGHSYAGESAVTAIGGVATAVGAGFYAAAVHSLHQYEQSFLAQLGAPGPV